MMCHCTNEWDLKDSLLPGRGRVRGGEGWGGDGDSSSSGSRGAAGTKRASLHDASVFSFIK